MFHTHVYGTVQYGVAEVCKGALVTIHMSMAQYNVVWQSSV